MRIFPVIEKRPTLQTVLKIIDRGLTIEKPHNFDNHLDTWSYLRASLMFEKCNFLRISWSWNETDDKLALGTGVVTRGIVISFEIDLPWDAKKVWYQIAVD